LMRLFKSTAAVIIATSCESFVMVIYNGHNMITASTPVASLNVAVAMSRLPHR
jgi:hypothetical protein